MADNEANMPDTGPTELSLTERIIELTVLSRAALPRLDTLQEDLSEVRDGLMELRGSLKENKEHVEGSIRHQNKRVDDTLDSIERSNKELNELRAAMESVQAVAGWKDSGGRGLLEVMRGMASDIASTSERVTQIENRTKQEEDDKKKEARRLRAKILDLAFKAVATLAIAYLMAKFGLSSIGS